jgi:hypothetical protein
VAVRDVSTIRQSADVHAELPAAIRRIFVLGADQRRHDQAAVAGQQGAAQRFHVAGVATAIEMAVRPWVICIRRSKRVLRVGEPEVRQFGLGEPDLSVGASTSAVP